MPRTRKRPNEPIAPAQIPGGRVEPKVPDDVELSPDEVGVGSDGEERVETEEEQQARDSEKAFDQAMTRNPPG